MEHARKNQSGRRNIMSNINKVKFIEKIEAAIPLVILKNMFLQI